MWWFTKTYQKGHKYLIFQWHIKNWHPPLPALRNLLYHPFYAPPPPTPRSLVIHNDQCSINMKLVLAKFRDSDGLMLDTFMMDNFRK